MKPTHLERRAAAFDLRGRQRRLLRFPSVDVADDHRSVHERPVTARVRSIRGSFEETPLGTDVDGVSGRSALPGSRQRWLNAISGKESSRARLSAGEKLDQDADRRPGVGLELRSESARPGIAATIPPELDAVSDSALLRHARKLDVVVLDVDSEPKLRPAAPHPDDERKIVRVGPRGVSFDDVVGAIHDRLDEVRGRECSVRGRWATVGVNVQVEPIGGAGFTPVGRSKNAMRPCVPPPVGRPHLHLGLRCPIDHGVGVSDHVKRPGAIREADAARPFLTAASPFPHIQHAGHRVHLHRKAESPATTRATEQRHVEGERLRR